MLKEGCACACEYCRFSAFFFFFQPTFSLHTKKKKITHAAYEKQKSVFFFLVPFFC